MIDGLNINTGMYAGLVHMAFWVVVLSAPILFDMWKNNRSSLTFTMSLGVCLSWLGKMNIRGWFLVYIWQISHGQEVAWMLPHWFVALNILLMIVGGALHVRTFTYHYCGERFWQWVSIGTAVIAVSVFTLGHFV